MRSAALSETCLPDKLIAKGMGHQINEMISAKATLTSRMFVGVIIDLVFPTMVMTKQFPTRPITTISEYKIASITLNDEAES